LLDAFPVSLVEAVPSAEAPNGDAHFTSKSANAASTNSDPIISAARPEMLDAAARGIAASFCRIRRFRRLICTRQVYHVEGNEVAFYFQVIL